MRIPLLLLFGLSLIVALGCSSSSKDNSFGEMSGTATIDGEPITAGTVTLISDDGTKLATGTLTGKGTFVVKAPPLGKMKVYIDVANFENFSVDMNPKRPANQPGMVYPDPDVMGMVYKPIPDKYKKAQTSDVYVDVKSGKFTYDITLSSK